ncbi:shikimate kinase [Halonotius pteroides]|uniref:Shikimate kinase n=1 Tax=Halonotius pteroides TaxID=268735 RepID=A0A3A6PZE6_9EURY|nr:shikimate kinase [Halonotius pteroides]RJX49298.1 shikimate kinase [Halonotius pteroides]
MNGVATAPGASTILNALATGQGSAFAIDVETTATVKLAADADAVTGEITDATDADTRLIERCVERVVDRFGNGEGGVVTTDSEVPMAAGLKSSSAAANATVLATLDALGVTVVSDDDTDTAAVGDAITKLGACRIGVEAARDVGVTITGAFDDASASMLGGVVVTDNTADELLAHEPREWDVLVWTPPERAYSADADVDRCENVAKMADLVAELALDGRFGEAMTVNGLAYVAALDFDTDPTVEAMPHCHGVSLSGTGPSVVAVGDETSLAPVSELWAERDGTLIETTTRTTGASIQ